MTRSGHRLKGSTLLDFQGTTLNANSASTDRFQLRDIYVLLYSGNTVLDESKLQYDNGDVKYKGNALRDGAWALFRIEKSATRTDLAGREWHARFETAMRELAKTNPNNDVITKNYEEATVLLYADQDFTDVDKDVIVSGYKKTIADAKALNSLGQSSAVSSAINNSSVTPKIVDTGFATNITPTSSDQVTYFADVKDVAGITVGSTHLMNVDASKVHKTIDPKKLDFEFEKIKKSVGAAAASPGS